MAPSRPRAQRLNLTPSCTALGALLYGTGTGAYVFSTEAEAPASGTKGFARPSILSHNHSSDPQHLACLHGFAPCFSFMVPKSHSAARIWSSESIDCANANPLAQHWSGICLRTQLPPLPLAHELCFIRGRVGDCIGLSWVAALCCKRMLRLAAHSQATVRCSCAAGWR